MSTAPRKASAKAAEIRRGALSILLEERVYPALFDRMDSAFPEFRFVKKGESWTATSWPTGFDVANDKNPGRLQVYRDNPYGVKVHGHPLVPWLVYLNRGPSPRGQVFLDLVRDLCTRAGVPFPERERDASEEEAAARWEDRRAAMEGVLEVCRKCLLEDALDSIQARRYLEGRGLTIDQAGDLGIGLYRSRVYVKRMITGSWGAAREAGLLWSKLNGYLIFPWRDASGSILTFYGRWPGSELPEKRAREGWSGDRKAALAEWSEEDPAARQLGPWVEPRIPKTVALRGAGTKGSPLYFDRARRAGHSRLVAVEGVLDAAVLQALGDARVVAYVAANFNKNQVDTMVRYRVESVTIVADPDGGGDKGADDSTVALMGAGIRTYVAPRLPDGLDPDEFVISRGVDAWHRHVREAVPGAVHRARRMMGDVTSTSPEIDKRGAIDRVVAYAGTLGDGLDREAVLSLAAERTGYPIDAIRGEAKSEAEAKARATARRPSVNGVQANGQVVMKGEDAGDGQTERPAEPGPATAARDVGPPAGDPPAFAGPVRSLKGDLLGVHPLPEGLIPLPFRRWVVDIAMRGCFPIEYPTVAALIAASSLLGRSLTVRPKRRDSWTVVPNLWGAIVGPPGLQKSPAANEAILPIRRLAAEAIKADEEARRRAREDASIAAVRAKEAQKRLVKAVADKAPEIEIRRLASCATTAEGGDSGPPLKRYIVNDSTIEKLGELLGENPRGLFHHRDELVGMLKAMDKQGHEGDRTFLLESWNGDGSYTFDRIGRGTKHIRGLCLSIFGTIQPGPLARYLKRSATGEDADGLMPRFQLLVYPDPPEKFINIDRWPDEEAKGGAFEVYRWIDSIDPASLGAEREGDDGLPFLRFDEAAQGLFDEWRESLENRLRSGSEAALMENHLAKYRSLMPSLALLIHVIDSAGCQRLGPVTHAAAEMAAAWCEFLEGHARRVYQYAIEGDPEIAARLGERIKQSLPNPFTFRVVAQKGWSGLDTVEDVRKAVGILEDRGWVKVVPKPPGPKGGPWSEEIWINPAIHPAGANGDQPS